MPNPRSYSHSFAGGEITPEMFGRMDDVRYQTGLSTCRNFVTKPHGPAANRAGFALVRQAKLTSATRVIPFIYSPDQSFAIEIGEHYFRFHTQGAVLLSGGQPYEVVHPYAAADLGAIKHVQSNDVLTLVHPSYPPAELRRNATLDWTYAAIVFGSLLVPPTSVSATATPATTNSGTPTLQSYVVTAVAGTDESAASSNGS